MFKEVYTVPEVAKIFKISTVSVNRLLQNNKLQAFRTSENANWKIPRKDLIIYMTKNNIPMEFIHAKEIKILVIDDEVLVTEAIVEDFNNSTDFIVETAHSGFAAGTKLETFRPDIVILDIFLGDMDGREFFKYIRNHMELKSTRVIGISGKVKQNEIDEFVKMGFDKFIKKPFEMDILKNTIKELIE